MRIKLIKNTLVLIATSLIIRVLSLANRIILTRLLGNEGISLYVIILPSLMLFMSIAGFSLNTALSKVIAENAVSKNTPTRKSSAPPSPSAFSRRQPLPCSWSPSSNRW